jgi:hypothetical protein
MRWISIWLMFAVLLFVWLLAAHHRCAPPMPSWAHGNPASCTEAAFDAALTTAGSGGGVITFNCGPAVTTINFTVFKVVNLGNVTIDGGERIILNAGALERHFFAGPSPSGCATSPCSRAIRWLAAAPSKPPAHKSFLRMSSCSTTALQWAGGAIYCYDGTLTITNSRLAGNRADTGGAIYNDGCVVTIQNTTFQDNQATGALGRGGAIENALTRPTHRAQQPVHRQPGVGRRCDLCRQQCNDRARRCDPARQSAAAMAAVWRTAAR